LKPCFIACVLLYSWKRQVSDHLTAVNHPLIINTQSDVVPVSSTCDVQEEQLFHDLAAVIARVKASASATEARDLVLQLRRMCAAVRASLETHVRAEEAELWPLFSEHFSIKEQQHLVGVIIGRTGAEVLQVSLSCYRCDCLVG
jgi:hypothetical protein